MFGLAVLLAAVVVQVVRARRAASAVAAAAAVARSTELEQGTAVRYAFGQLASRLARFAELRRHERRQELPVFADRIAVALAFYLLPGVPDVRANVYQLSADLRALEPIGHGGAEDTAGVFRAGTPYGDRNLDWLCWSGVAARRRGPRRRRRRRRGPARLRTRYRSYVSVVIRSEEYSFGMLTVDSPVRTRSPTSTPSTSP